MPALSLVVCVYKEERLLRRLITQAAGCYDDLVVVHDGPESGTAIARLVAENAGRFFIRPRAYQQEPHWPFAWQQAAHDWILRLDADEVLSTELKNWLQAFRRGSEPTVSGYTCIWPLWDGRKIVTKRWPDGRIFLVNKQRVRFFGMVEQVPVPDGDFEPLPFALEHRPERKSFGLRNILRRRQAYRWRKVIAQSLIGKPTDLPGWRWSSEDWPDDWEQIRVAPLRTGMRRLLTWPLYSAKQALRHGEFPYPGLVLQSGVHHFLICLQYRRARRATAQVH